MTEIKNIADVLEIAVRMERKGVEFYNKLAEIAPLPQAQGVFSFLAQEEEKHIGVFREMLDKIADYTPRFKYPGEYELFLEGVAARSLESFKKMEKVALAKNAKEALEVGITLENESIEFYESLSGQFDSGRRKIVDKVIKEEKKHIEKLEQLKNHFKL